MTRRGFKDYDLFQAEVLSSLVKQGPDAVAAINRELAREPPKDDFQPLWDAVSSFDN